MSYSIETASWPDDREALRLVRETVFVHEQGVPLDMEWDEDDSLALHMLARDAQGTPIGTGRLLPDGRIGRMAVLATWRGRGVGSALLSQLIAAARERGLAQVRLHAQCHALDFYARLGFQVSGEIFDECGIPHRYMSQVLVDD
jgi:predicted GNAT family N-acyltransferase